MRVFKKLLLVPVLALLPFAAFAQSIEELQQMSMEERRALRESMSDEELAKMREQRRSEYEGLSEGEKQAVRKKRSEQRGARRQQARERWEGMSEEERAAAREKYKGKAKKHKRHGKGKGRGKRGGIKGENPVKENAPADSDQAPD